jgi:hypothetical protein
LWKNHPFRYNALRVINDDDIDVPEERDHATDCSSDPDNPENAHKKIVKKKKKKRKFKEAHPDLYLPEFRPNVTDTNHA